MRPTRVVHGLGRPAGWVGLDWVGLGRVFRFLVGWIGSWVRSERLQKNENQNHRLRRKHGSIRSPTSEMGRQNSAGHQTTGTVVFLVREELAQYKAIQVPGAHDSPLVFWRQNQKDFPVLSQVARRVFCISASSVQSQRDFSSVGHTTTHQVPTVCRQS